MCMYIYLQFFKETTRNSEEVDRPKNSELVREQRNKQATPDASLNSIAFFIYMYTFSFDLRYALCQNELIGLIYLQIK